jgi:transposase
MDVATDTLLHLSAEELCGMVQSLRQTVAFKQATIVGSGRGKAALNVS